MYVNKCTKCGTEFETKNPKRVICPDCLYPDKKMMLSSEPEQETIAEKNQGIVQNDVRQEDPQKQQFYNSYSYGPPQQPTAPRQNNYSRRDSYSDRGNYQRRDNYSGDRGGYQRPQSGYQRPQDGYQRPQDGYQRPRQDGYQRPQQGGYQRPPQQGGYQRPQQGGYNRPQNGFRPRPQSGAPRFGGNRPRPPVNKNKPLLVNKEQLEQIEALYKAMLPLPNPDAHEVIGEKIGLESRKVFFGINLVRQKLMLPKLPFPKRKLAISPDQMFAIQNLYEPLLPLPPIGCHKIIAAQLKMDEWRVHVGIGLIRAKMGFSRWNQERQDAPEEFKKTAEEEKTSKVKKTKKEKSEKKVKEPKAKKETKTKKESKK